jgi:hypothetical protein
MTTREAWLDAFTDAARPMFEKHGAALPKLIRCGIGFPSKGSRSNVIGECWADVASADGAVEIFIRPSLQSDSSRIADVLTHELCHAALGIVAGHGPKFKRLALALGLEGKMTATVAGDGWKAWADPILEALGPLPGAELRGCLAGGKKKQTTRMLKLTCDDCAWSCRTTASMIEDNMICPTGCGGHLLQA